jgi:signal transduction histidine kinase
VSRPLRPSFPPPPARAASRRRWGALAALVAWTAAVAATIPAGPEPLRGLPFIRTYPLDEIGAVPRGLRLGFDAFGRVAVMYDGIYSVLNDSAWVDRIDKSADSKVRMTRIRVVNGTYYYDGRGSWGVAEPTADGSFRAAPLVPADAPAWTRVTPFNKVLGTGRGVYFYELNGVVYWDFARRKNVFFEMPRLMSAFPVGDRVFVSCQDRQIRELQTDAGISTIVSVPGLDGEVVEFAVALDDTHALLALVDGRLFTFDGTTATPWLPQPGGRLGGKITAMERLVDGGVAIAVDDKGILLFAADGTPRWSLLATEFRRVRDMAAGEPGVLWVVGENAVHRIFYDSPLTSFGHQVGLKAAWPNLAVWNGRILVRSNQTIYEAVPTGPAQPPAFRVVAGSPTRPVECIATSGAHLLAGTAEGAFSVGPNGTLTPVIHLANVTRLEFVQPDTCLVIGNREIAAVRYTDGRWRECAPRIPGVGDSPIVVQQHRFVWIEMGGDQVARVGLRDGVIDLRRIPLPWRDAAWTNVGQIGRTIVLTGPEGQRIYYDEERDATTTDPELDRLLNRSPYWLLRMTEDAAGVIWATHVQGVVTFTPRNGDYVFDPSTFELRNDSYPIVTLLPGNDVWIAGGWSLYHVEPNAPPTAGRVHTKLVSLVADHHNLELLNATGLPASPPRLSYDDNSLSFRFFSGTYAWRFPPQYEYRLGPAESWTPVDPNLVLRFPKLRDGAYVLEMRQTGPQAPDAATFAFPFFVNPPWYRTPYSYGVYALLLLLSLLALARWMNHRSLARNVALERLVHERTQELEVTMEKLAGETRNAATLAERSRLAGEIHDSLQQGLSGTILHLDTTMTHPSLAPEVRAQLAVMRSMLSYSREEVQQAVWNLESPLLQNSTLGNALRKLASYINSGSIEVRIEAPPDAAPLAPAVQHNLLRIAQEAITNAVKHAAARRIDVTLEAQPESVVLRVTDDGQGFDPEARSKVEGHFGLRGLRSRARSIGAQLEIISSPGTGTTVQVTVPLRTNPVHDHQPETQPA